MPVFRINGKNILFIHVPKTGGTTVETILESQCEMSLHSRGGRLLKPSKGSFLTRSLPLQHFHAEILESMFAAGFFDYAFMVVRDPLERLKSEYRHSLALRHPDTLLNFGHWVQLMLRLSKLAPNLRNNHFRPQSQFRCFNAEVFKLEDGLGDLFRALSSRLGIVQPETLPHERRSNDVTLNVTPKIKSLVRSAFDADYRTFSY